MARIKMQEIVEHLDFDFKRALEAMAQEVLPESQIDRSELYRAFRRAVGRKFDTWASVPDECITDWKK